MPKRAARAARAFASLLAWGLSTLTGEAAADSVEGTRSELLVERAHGIRLTLHPGHAELVVRRTVHNGGERHDQAVFHIDLPPEAVAIGLATLGSEGGRPRWFQGELMEAEAAAAKYRELTGIGGYYPKDPALLSWRSQSLLALQVFPCAPQQDKTIEYTLSIPTHYRDGAHHLELPALGTDALTATITARSGDREYTLTVGGAAPPPLIRPEPETTLDFALIPRRAPVLDGMLATVEFAPERVLTRYAVYAAPRLSEVPRGARIVLVVDRSLSTDPDFLARSRQALDAYLSHFQDAEVELIAFDRKLARPFGKFLPVAEARKALSALELTRRNGSDVDSALAEADRLLAGTPAKAPRRIVLLTDGLTRSGLTPERLRAATLASGAVTHVGILAAGSASLTRDDEHPWTRGLRPNRGLVWRASAGDGAGSAEERRVFEEWARPTRLHHVKTLSTELALQEALQASPQELEEGQAVENLLVASKRLPALFVEGELWTERVSASFLSDAESERAWSALVFGSSVLDELSEPEMMTLALRGRAVSPVTSYLAIEPGVRPSTEGLDWSGSGFGIGLGSLRSGAACVGGRAPTIDRDAFLQQVIAADWRRCGGRPGGGSVTLETTAAEIVAVDATSSTSDDPLAVRCLQEAVWDLVLPAQFEEDWNTWTVHV